MSHRAQYMPGPARGAQVERGGDKWTLILVRELRHTPEKVWQALTDPVQLREWAPFDADGSLATAGATVKLNTVGAPRPYVTETIVRRAEAPKVLEYTWGGGDVRWELEDLGTGTRLTLWANIDRRFISMGAAGWHLCFDVLDRLLGGTPIGRIVAGEAIKFEWPRLNAEYAKQFGLELVNWPPHLRKQAQEYEEAREIQQGLMPKQIPQIAGLEISGSWRPARVVGGDYFDVFNFSGRRVGLCIADVSGKGMPAALLMSNLQAVVKALASENISPKELVEKVNRVMSSNTTEAKFITLFYGLLDLEEKILRYANAGHNSPILTRRDGTQIRLEEGGVVLGIFRERSYEEGEIELRPGDRLVMFTDGVSEADREGEEFGEERLAELSRGARQLSAEALRLRLLERVSEFCDGGFEDDATLLVVAVSEKEDHAVIM